MSEAVYAEKSAERGQSEVESLVSRLEEQCESLGKVISQHAQRIAAYTRNEVEVKATGSDLTEIARVAQTGMGQRLDQVRIQLNRHSVEVMNLTSLFEG